MTLLTLFTALATYFVLLTAFAVLRAMRLPAAVDNAYMTVPIFLFIAAIDGGIALWLRLNGGNRGPHLPPVRVVPFLPIQLDDLVLLLFVCGLMAIAGLVLAQTIRLVRERRHGFDGEAINAG